MSLARKMRKECRYESDNCDFCVYNSICYLCKWEESSFPNVPSKWDDTTIHLINDMFHWISREVDR